MACTELTKKCRALREEYKARFGESFGVPFGFDWWTEQDNIDEMTWALENGIPFNEDSPRWRWSRGPYPEGAVI